MLEHPFLLVLLLMVGGAVVYICLPRKIQEAVLLVCLVLLFVLILLVVWLFHISR